MHHYTQRLGPPVRPLIATGWSGAVDVRAPEDSRLVGHELVSDVRVEAGLATAQTVCEPATDEGCTMTASVVPSLVCTMIVNWKRLADTVACIRSCQQLAYPHNTLLLVDDGSTDGSVAGRHQLFPGLPIIATGANLGFAGRCNLGIETARRA